MRSKSRASLVLGVVLCAACTYDSGGDDAVGATFEPIIGGTVASAYPEAAYLNIDTTAAGGYACSATLIAPRVVLTAGHCVDGHSRFEVHVGTAYQVSTSSATYDWNEHGAQTVNPNHHDIGLVFLSTPIKLAAYPVLSSAKVAENTKAINVGRVLNGTLQNGAYQAPTTLLAADKIGYPFDYTSADVIQPGDSGGPVFLSGSHTIVAVNSGAGGNTQVLARVDLLSSWIATQVAAHGDAPATGSGGASGASGAPNAAGAAGTKASGGSGGTDAGKAGAASVGSAGAKPTAGAAGSAGSAGSAGAAKAGASSGSAGAAACMGTKEQELNDSWLTANKLLGSACGELGSTMDVDWFGASVAPGSHVIELVPGSDATVSLGIVSGATCVVSVSNALRATLTVSGGALNVCFKVSSASKKAQPYRLSVN